METRPGKSINSEYFVIVKNTCSKGTHWLRKPLSGIEPDLLPNGSVHLTPKGGCNPLGHHS